MCLSTAQHPKQPLLVKLFGEPAMDKYNLIPRLHPAFHHFQYGKAELEVTESWVGPGYEARINTYW